ncbi:hypothetical protein Bhyg_06616 [Pseudolycoriella hygida]|uniref:Uncharacterized protein n=1 Tax=Pseudolycoriella hygida TaxID=35572 RepID=A0A9Q0N2N4_9DIPT|nr:hypothetical protein Bhyg_06616 [Pseudolycoriella hygida]
MKTDLSKRASVDIRASSSNRYVLVNEAPDPNDNMEPTLISPKKTPVLIGNVQPMEWNLVSPVIHTITFVDNFYALLKDNFLVAILLSILPHHKLLDRNNKHVLDCLGTERRICLVFVQ